jgi:WD40 repeat protein
VLECGTGKIRSQAETPGAVSAVALSADGRYMAAAYTLGSGASMISVFTSDDGKPAAPALSYRHPVRALAVGHEGLKVATATANEVDLIGVKSGVEVWRASYLEPVNDLVFSPDGSKLAVAGTDRTARIIDVTSGAETARLNHRGPVLAVAFGPFGNYVASASQDKTARILDASTGVEVSRMIHPQSVTALAFGPRGHFVVTASEDGAARVFGIADENQMSQITRRRSDPGARAQPGRALRSNQR